MKVKYSKDVNALINKAKQICLDYQRPYICPDILWTALIEYHTGAIEEVLVNQMAFDLTILDIEAHSILSTKRESKKPKTNLNVDARAVLKLAEKLRKVLDEEDITTELLLLALVTYDKPCDFFKLLLNEYAYSQSDYVTCTTCFITGRDMTIEFEEEEDEELQFEIELEEEILDPFGDNPTLEEYGINLNKEAAKGKYDNLVPFKDKIKDLSVVLCRNGKPNAVIVGPQGCGKTSVIMSLARKIVNNEVSHYLKDKVIYEISLGSMVAGTEFRGNFEERLKGIIEEAKRYKNVILFFDEIHTLIGAGGTGKQGDLEASNILKPYLATGEICCIGATTDYEYNQKFKKDKALDRRFEKINFQPPTREQAEKMLPHLIKFYEDKNDKKFCKQFKWEVISLCEQLMPNRNYPDKLVDAIDHSLALGKVYGVDKISQDIYREYFLPKTGIFGNDLEFSLLLKTIKEEKINLALTSYKENIFSERSAPRSIGICGETTLNKEISSFLKSRGFPFYSFSGKSLNLKSDIIGFSEEYLCSLAQKVAATESPFLIITDTEFIPNQVQILLSEILSEGEITMQNGETVSFNNSTFLLFSKLENKKAIGFEGKLGKNPKMPKMIKKELEHLAIV